MQEKWKIIVDAEDNVYARVNVNLRGYKSFEYLMYNENYEARAQNFLI